jgi:hypothetical protein
VTTTAQTAAAPAPTAVPRLGDPDPNPANGGLYSVDATTKAAADEVQAARLAVTDVSQKINDQQAAVEKLQQTTIGQDPEVTSKLQAATSTLNALYGDMSTANNRVAMATTSYQTAVSKAIDQHTVDPSQVALAQASAAKAGGEGDYARAQAQVLTDGAAGQRAVAAAEVASYNAQAASAQATADATRIKAGPEAEQATAQAHQLQAQADQTNALLPGLKAKQGADISQTEAQTRLTDQNSALAAATTGKTNADTAYVQAQTAYETAVTTGLLPANIQQTQAQAGELGARGAAETAQAEATRAAIQQNLQGPLYGLQDRLNAIRQIQGQVFGPGGSGDVNEANDLLRQFTESTIGGTTPYAANVAAANAGLTAFGTQASLTNAAQQALASRASALGQVGSNALQTLAALNANAPKGSTLLAAAFNDVVNLMASKMNTGALAPPPQPTAPALPPYLQRLVYGGGGGAPGAPGAAPPPAAAATPPPPAAAAPPPGNYNPQQLPMPAVPPPGAPTGPNIPGQAPPPPTPGMSMAAPGRIPTPLSTPGMSMFSPGQQPQTSAPITINIGGGSSAAPAPAPQPAMPGVLAQHAPATTDAVHALWGNELSSGAVTSPMATGVNPNGSAAGPVGVQTVNTNPTQVAAEGGVLPLTTGSQPPVNTWPGAYVPPGNALSAT